jgi:protein-S-isoprenylcysteine O-methyltransferase Ste14
MRHAGLMGFHFAWRGWILGALLASLVAARSRSHEPLRPEWLALLVAGLAWRAWAGFHIEGHSNGAALSGPSLAMGGPYHMSRHPLYFANLLCAAGIVLYAHCLPAWAALAGLAVVAAHHEALARAEERFLLARHGEGYRSYMRVTSRWPMPRLPRRVRGTGGAGVGPGWGGGSFKIFRATPAGAGSGMSGGWRTALARQGWNLAKGCACALLIRIAAVAG